MGTPGYLIMNIDLLMMDNNPSLISPSPSGECEGEKNGFCHPSVPSRG
jgi:hypothetical protein